MWNDTIQQDAIPYDTRQYGTMRYDVIWYEKMRNDTMQKIMTLLSFYTEMNVLESAWLKKLTHNLDIRGVEWSRCTHTHKQVRKNEIDLIN